MTDVLVTASDGTLPALEARLPELTVVRAPLFSAEPPGSWDALDGALARLRSYAAVALTSPRAGSALVERLASRGARWPSAGPALWAVGARTAASVATLAVAQLPAEAAEDGGSAGASLARALLRAGVSGAVLFPCGERHRDELPRLLRDAGMTVDEAVAYRVRASPAVEVRRAAAGARGILATSPRAVEALMAAVPPAARAALVAIGATTAAAAEALGWPPAAVAAAPTVPDVAAAIHAALASPRPGARP